MSQSASLQKHCEFLQKISTQYLVKITEFGGEKSIKIHKGRSSCGFLRAPSCIQTAIAGAVVIVDSALLVLAYESTILNCSRHSVNEMLSFKTITTTVSISIVVCFASFLTLVIVCLPYPIHCSCSHIRSWNPTWWNHSTSTEQISTRLTSDVVYIRIIMRQTHAHSTPSNHGSSKSSAALARFAGSRCRHLVIIAAVPLISSSFSNTLCTLIDCWNG